MELLACVSHNVRVGELNEIPRFLHTALFKSWVAGAVRVVRGRPVTTAVSAAGDDPALPDALCHRDILTQDSQGGYYNHHPLEHGQEESGNPDNSKMRPTVIRTGRRAETIVHIVLAKSRPMRISCWKVTYFLLNRGGRKRARHFQRHTTQVQDAKEIDAPARFSPNALQMSRSPVQQSHGEKTVLATEHEEFFIFETYTRFHVHGVRRDDTIFYMSEQ